MKTTIICLVLLACLSCSPITVSYDYDKGANFTDYGSYQFTDVSQLGINEFDKGRIIAAVDKEMLARGYKKSEPADLLVDLKVKLAQEETATATTTGGGYGAWGYGFSSGFSTTTVDVDKYIDGTLFISLVDTKQQRIVWQGRGTKTLNEKSSPQDHETNINKAVNLIFEKYPIKENKK